LKPFDVGQLYHMDQHFRRVGGLVLRDIHRSDITEGIMAQDGIHFNSFLYLFDFVGDKWKTMADKAKLLASASGNKCCYCSSYGHGCGRDVVLAISLANDVVSIHLSLYRSDAST
jgi:hypothetical protein